MQSSGDSQPSQPSHRAEDTNQTHLPSSTRRSRLLFGESATVVMLYWLSIGKVSDLLLQRNPSHKHMCCEKQTSEEHKKLDILNSADMSSPSCLNLTAKYYWFMTHRLHPIKTYPLDAPWLSAGFVNGNYVITERYIEKSVCAVCT